MEYYIERSLVGVCRSEETANARSGVRARENYEWY